MKSQLFAPSGTAIQNEPVRFNARPCWISVTVLQSIVTVAVGMVLPPGKFSLDMTSVVMGVMIIALPSAFLAYRLVSQSVGPLASLWRLPKTTLLFSRPMVRMIGSVIACNLIGFAILAVFIDVCDRTDGHGPERKRTTGVKFRISIWGQKKRRSPLEVHRWHDHQQSHCLLAF